MSKKIPTNNYVNHFDSRKSHHLAFLQAVLDRVDKLDPEALQDGGDLRSIWKAAVETKAPLIQAPAPKTTEGQHGEVETSWESIKAMAMAAGAKYPELVAAQWALESDWGLARSGKNNFFGLKAVGNKTYMDFSSPKEAVTYLVDRWYKDFKTYKGVNNAANRDAAAKTLVKEGYAEDPKYAEKLIKLMNQQLPVAKLVVQQPSVSPAKAVKADVTQWKTRVKAMNLSQPDSLTCQAACIAMAVGDKNIMGIRSKLLASGGVAGDPSVMGKVIRTYKNANYSFDGNGSLEKVYEWLKAGELLITHGWFTRSGHVIILDGLMQNPINKSYSLDVKDPWSEFMADTWSYKKTVKFYDGFYSENVIYAACVAGASAVNAASIYKNKGLDRKKGGMWVHRFKP
jgi:hypothetical protein